METNETILDPGGPTVWAEKKRAPRASTSFKRATDAIAKLRDCHSSARHFGFTHAQLVEARAKAVSSVGRMNSHDAAMVSGYSRALYDAHWSIVKWVLYIDGAPATSDEISRIADKEERAGSSRIATWDRVTGRHEYYNGQPFTEFDKVRGDFAVISEKADAEVANVK